MPHDTSMTPGVSLLIRSMNRATLPEVLACAQAQTYSPLYVIVVNASGEPHQSLPDEGHVSLVEPSPQRPLPRADAANLALDSVTTPLAMFVDDDDLFDSGHVARLVALLETQPDAAAAYAGVRLVNAENGDEQVLDEAWRAGMLWARNFLPIHSVLFRMQAVETAKARFDTSFSQLEDWDFWLQLASAHGAFAHCSGVSATYRLALGQSGLSAQRDISRYEAARASLYAKWLPQLQVDTLGELLASLVRDYEQLRWDVSQLHRQEASLQQTSQENLGRLLELREHYEKLQALHQALNEKHRELWASHHALGKTCEELRANNEYADRRTNEKAEALSQLHEALSDLETRHAEIIATLHEKTEELTRMESRHADVVETLQQREAENIVLTEKLEHLEYVHHTVVHSRSWRWMAFMRHSTKHYRTWRSHLAAAQAKNTSQAVQRQAPAGPVDIIVPVYKGLEETRACLESVWASTSQTSYRLVVINDASPEPEVTAWLRSLADDPQRPMVLLENAQNLGFVGTVNRGMAYSADADVVLLNSDAEVANDWLDRLVRAAYSPGTAPVSSVTPFSNNATICSYPKFCQDNELPPGYDLPKLDRLFAEANSGQYVDIPTGIGFCMYICRDSLAQVGLFDEARFGKGYGEENDFCMRAMEAGWRHLHALDTFVWHKGSVSFGDTQPERVTHALRVLHELHPSYESRVHQFIQHDPAKRARHRADILRLRESPLPRVLLVNHQRGGGTEYHCRELSDALAEQVEFLMLRPASNGATRLTHYRAEEALTLDYQLPAEFDELVALLRAIGISRVHVHHWLGLHGSVMHLAQTLGVPQWVTLHDYYSACPQITLTGADNRYCGEEGLEQCRRCLKQLPASGNVPIETWRSEHGDWLRSSERVITPSSDAAIRMASYFPEVQFEAIPHPDQERAAYAPPQVAPAVKEPLRVAVIGALSLIKGADMVEAVANEAKRRGASVEFKLFGYAYRDFTQHSHLHVTGRYDSEQLPAMLREWQPHIVWFPALWPETYSYTLSTCLEMQLPVVSTDIGAIAERLNGRALSWTLPLDTSEKAWCDWFEKLPEALRHESHSLSIAAKSTSSNEMFYHQHYAQGLHIPTDLPPLPETWSNHIETVTARDTRIRLACIDGLYWLRRQPLLRSIARRIPMTWQRKAKSWLLRET